MANLDLFQDYEYFNLGMYGLYGVVILGMHTYISFVQVEISDNSEEYTFFFHAGSWSIADAMLYITFCFNSGLLFDHSSVLGGAFTLLFVLIPFWLFCPQQNSVLLVYSVAILPLFYLAFVISAHDVEIKLRYRFLRLSALGNDLRRQDTLIHSILPSDISVALKKGDVQKLASYHDNVTILFCTIVGFGSQSSTSHAEDIVKILIRIVTMFDQISEHMGVYKVENIADTYMCCDGLDKGPDDSTSRKDHSIRIARTAVAMREAVEYFRWRWSDGSPIQLKIGIHSGPVTAGVIGTKSYSYHLFGDTVNTAARMCSCSIPGQICMSKETARQIRDVNKDLFSLRHRGKVQVKGKGDMNLFWLDGYKKHQSCETHAQIYGIDTRQVLSDNIGRFYEKAPNDSSIKIGRFALSYYNNTLATTVITESTRCGFLSRCLESAYYRLTTASFRYNVSRLRMLCLRRIRMSSSSGKERKDSDEEIRSQVDSPSSSSKVGVVLCRSPSKVEPVSLEELEKVDNMDARHSHTTAVTDKVSVITSTSFMTQSSRYSSNGTIDAAPGNMGSLSVEDDSYSSGGAPTLQLPVNGGLLGGDRTFDRGNSMFTIYSEVNEDGDSGTPLSRKRRPQNAAQRALNESDSDSAGMLLY